MNTVDVAEHMNRLRASIRARGHADEAQIVAELMDACATHLAERESVLVGARGLVEACRAKTDRAGTLDAFLREFGLSNREGIALMCLAESLLRVPDEATADRLIAEKIHQGNWSAHRGQSESTFVNASVWGLMLTGKILPLERSTVDQPASFLRGLVGRAGEPVVRAAMLQAMRIMGSQFVLGRDIDEAMKRAAKEQRAGSLYSFDMLGEGARTEQDAQRYFDDYQQAIARISASANAVGADRSHGISVKLSALHPRYEQRQEARVEEQLYARISVLARQAKAGGIGLSIDAEEAARLELSLDLFERLARDPELSDWQGLGFVLQAYQKRAPAVAQWLISLARSSQRRLMVRLVKGAYWDSEIKHAQEQGLSDYPVYTRKCHTDLSYERCAALLLAADDCIYPQFATHNAHTVATILQLAGDKRAWEFQRLHGMGELLFEQLLSERPTIPVRVYAPVGSHRDLLPYLVRRLLENGANSSFVNRFLDADTAVDTLVSDPLDVAMQRSERRHPHVPLPVDLYRNEPWPWRNARGIDLDDRQTLADMVSTVAKTRGEKHRAAPLIKGEPISGEAEAVINPARYREVVGEVVCARDADIDRALAVLANAQPDWDALGANRRAELIEACGDALERDTKSLVALIALEAGRTLDDGVSEVREAVDFCRYYAQQARRLAADPTVLPGPTGEHNRLSVHGRGVFACISPWNFPLAIFTGQIVAALVAGNTVVAKPAEQTPLVAARAIKVFIDAGLPAEVIALLPGEGAQVGATLLSDPRVSGVVFTGGTDTAQAINRQLAARPGPLVPLIAETGGLNVMLVDATALPEQVVDDVISSAFQSAGQRCSALRVLYLQRDMADRVLEMLGGALTERVVGDPTDPGTDIGPVIDADARAAIDRHRRRLQNEAKVLWQGAVSATSEGYFVAPEVWEIDRLGQLEREVFGPILHVIRYDVADLPRIYADINASGYGLTLGVHSRIEGFAQEVFSATRVGNTYVNRNMVGAVVGVNPFGGQGLSGTGPKAGGPWYLTRFMTERTFTDNLVARGGNAQLLSLGD